MTIECVCEKCFDREKSETVFRAEIARWKKECDDLSGDNYTAALAHANNRLALAENVVEAAIEAVESKDDYNCYTIKSGDMWSRYMNALSNLDTAVKDYKRAALREVGK